MPRITYLPPEAAEAIVKFVQRGGALICDRIPTRSTTGEELTSLLPLFTGPEEQLWGDLTIRLSDYGEGRTLLFSEVLEDVYCSSIENEQPALRYLLKDTVREFLFGQGIRPHTRSSNPEIEVNPLLTADTIVLVLINHADQTQSSCITLYRPALEVRYAVDLVTMQQRQVREGEEGIEIDVDLGEREGLLLGLYAEKPVDSALATDGADPDRLTFEASLLNASGLPARGEHVVEVEVLDPTGERRVNYSGLRCTTNGVLKVDEPFAVNARRGKWTVSVFDRYTRQKRTAIIER